MPSLKKAKDRDKKRHKKYQGMRVSGKSVFLIQEIQRKRAEKIKEEKEKNG